MHGSPSTCNAEHITRRKRGTAILEERLPFCILFSSVCLRICDVGRVSSNEEWQTVSPLSLTSAWTLVNRIANKLEIFHPAHVTQYIHNH